MRNSISRIRGKPNRSSGNTSGKSRTTRMSSKHFPHQIPVIHAIERRSFSGLSHALNFKNLAIWKRNTDNLLITIDESSVDLNSIVNSFFTSTPSKPSTTSTPLPVATPDARTQELINKKLKKAKELGSSNFTILIPMVNVLFHMSIYKTPMSVLKDLEAIRRRFFNGHDQNSNQANWVKWDTVMSAKETGGLGVASFHALNRGLMFKWLWKFFVDKDSLWTRVIKAIHGDDGKLDKEVNICSRSSWLSIVKEAKVLKNKGVDFFEYLKLVVGDGRTIRFWKDKWYHAGILKDLFPRVFALETQKDVTIYDKLEAPSLEHTFRRSVRGGVEQTQFDAVILAADTINLVPQYDRYKWTLSNDGEYSVASFRKKVDCCRSSSDATRTRWVNFIPIKVNIVAWKIKLNALPTRFNLSCRGIDIESLTCPTCEGGTNAQPQHRIDTEEDTGED
ncbi:RNA-directed DNA polymerase, eukaryota, reverse transcriptase zinc-binding domain protein [Tanacetum coccineum]